MIISTKLTTVQHRQVSCLIMNCDNKQDMFDGLLSIGINAFHSIIMSNSFNKITNVQYTRLPIYYFEPSRATGKMQDRSGNFYIPTNN